MEKNNNCCIRSSRLFQKSVCQVTDKNGCKSSIEFGEENNGVCKNECHLVLEDSYQNSRPEQ